MEKSCTCCKIKKLINKNQIEIIWSIDDVKHVRPDLTDKQCREVLEKVDHYHDPDVGVSWYTLEYWADELFGSKEDEL